MKLFAQRLTSLLERRELTQGQVEVLTRGEVKRNHLSMILAGKREPKIGTAVTLARALEVSLDELCGLPVRTAGQLTSDEAELLNSYRAISANTRPMVLSAVKGFVPKK